MAAAPDVTLAEAKRELKVSRDLHYVRKTIMKSNTQFMLVGRICGQLSPLMRCLLN